MHRCARGAAKQAQRRLSMHPALSAWGAWLHGAHFCDPLTPAVAIHPAGRAIHQRLRQAAAAQGPQQSVGTGVGGGTRVVIGRRGQVHHPRGQPGHAAQGGSVVQVALQRGDVLAAQCRQPVGGRSQCQHPHTRRQQTRHPQADIPAADDQHTGATKAGRQRAEGALV